MYNDGFFFQVKEKKDEVIYLKKELKAYSINKHMYFWKLSNSITEQRKTV